MPKPDSAETRDDTRAQAAQRAQLERWAQLQRRQRELVIRALNDSRDSIIKTLSGAPSDWQRYRLAAMLAEIDSAIVRWSNQQLGQWRDGVNSAWAMGQALVDAPYAAVGFQGAFNAIDDRQLLAMRTFLVDKISNISASQRNSIRAQLNLAATGGISRAQAVQGITTIFDGDRRRALTITRTELGRAHSHATWLRLKQAALNDPDLRKQWRRSGKRFSREAHDFADGRVARVNEFFQIDGASLMYPRDPTAGAKHTINCGCTLLPWKKTWAVANPGAKPFTPAELAVQPKRVDIQAMLVQRAADAEQAMLAVQLFTPVASSLVTAAQANTLASATFNNARAAGLQEDEAAALAFWTLRGQLINTRITDGVDIEGMPAAQYAGLLSAALRKLGTTDQPLTRVVLRKQREDQLDGFVRDGVYTADQFMAFSMPGGRYLKAGLRPNLTINVKPGARSRGGVIDALSYNAREREVLFPPGTRFKVVDYRYRKSRHELWLEEL